MGKENIPLQHVCHVLYYTVNADTEKLQGDTYFAKINIKTL